MMGDLANHLWQSTIFAFVAGLLASALRWSLAVRFAGRCHSFRA